MKSSHDYKRALIVLCCFVLISACHRTPSPCQQLTGTWQGQYHDPSGLFSQKKQPIQLEIVEKKGQFFGYSKADDNISGQAISGVFSGQCREGKLSKVYLQNTERCGHFAPKGQITGRELFLNLPYENAMTQTDFQIRARRTDSQRPHIHPEPIDKIKTCH